MRSEILVLKIQFFCKKYEFLDVKIQILFFKVGRSVIVRFGNNLLIKPKYSMKNVLL